MFVMKLSKMFQLIIPIVSAETITRQVNGRRIIRLAKSPFRRGIGWRSCSGKR